MNLMSCYKLNYTTENTCTAETINKFTETYF